METESHGSLAEALAAVSAECENVIVHEEGCDCNPCSCRPFKVPSDEIALLSPEVVAAKLEPLVTRRNGG